MRVGVVGLGFGRHLLNTLRVRSDCIVGAVADFYPERLEGLASTGIPAYQDPLEMLEREPLDALVIASAPHVRADALDAALEKRLPVFMEKPLAGSVTQAQELCEKIGNHPVMLGFSFRFHDPVQRLLSELNSGLGSPVLLNAEYVFDWLPAAEGWLWDPEKGGGFFTENSCHLFDVVSAVMGQPKTVFAAGFDDGSRPSATAAAITLCYESGAVAALSVGGVGTGAMQDFPRLDVSCSSGRAHLRGRQHMWTELEWVNRGGTVQKVAYEPEALGRTRYSAAFDHFFSSIANDRPFDASMQHGLHAVQLADAVYRSIATGSPVNMEPN